MEKQKGGKNPASVIIFDAIKGKGLPFLQAGVRVYYYKYLLIKLTKSALLRAPKIDSTTLPSLLII